MPELKIHAEGKLKTVSASKGTLLLDALRFHNYDLYSPCGGIGSCGKCNVYIRDRGYVTSCLYAVEEDIEIVLPEASESRILAAQYEHTRTLPFSPGKVAGLSGNPFGVAIDLGTTTLVFHLVELKTGSLLVSRTEMNPQTAYGADVISRINYCITKPDGLRTLQTKVTDVINRQLDDFCKDFGFTPDYMVRIAVSGNTTMLHILAGVDPETLAFYPFTPVFTEARTLDAGKMGWHCHPEAEVNTLPSLSAYIGADIIAGIASLQPQTDPANALFIDIGTNGEMALITPGKIYCCATAAGPAFEGARISHGMGAVTGAIHTYYGEGQYQTIGDSEPVGICGSGLIDIVDAMLKSGLLGKDGCLESPHVVVPAENSGTASEICITPQDIREVQLAKSAIASGIDILTRRAGLSPDDIDVLYLAGGFGNHIRTESAVGIGLLPRELSGNVVPVGNTSGTGALLAVQSTAFEAVMRDILDRAVVYELSEDDQFFSEFALNMNFPF